MMKRLCCLCLMLFSLLVFSACSSHQWQVTTSDGKEYTAAGKPELDEDAKTYTFEDPQGNQVVLPQSVVQEMKEAPSN
ncbi:MAG: hypothetical protein PWQ57_2335 [Desulfovibrionales bacterium]|nr:hypothetical protein [Desulfovibrionales bacterium]